jgi:hypothetical protein
LGRRQRQVDARPIVAEYLAEGAMAPMRGPPANLKFIAYPRPDMLFDLSAT